MAVDFEQFKLKKKTYPESLLNLNTKFQPTDPIWGGVLRKKSIWKMVKIESTKNDFYSQ